MKPYYMAVPLGIILLILVIGIAAGPLWVASTTMPIRLQMASTFRSLTGFSTWFEDIQTLRNDRQQLVKQRNQLLAKVANLQAVERENEAIKKQFNIDISKSKRMILAHTAGLSQQGDATFLLIDKGSSDGLKIGQLVLTDGVLVGKLSQVSTHIATVTLLTSLGNTVPVVIRHGDSQTKGVVEGSFNLTAKLNQVLPTEQLNSGDVIETSSEGGVYPPGIVVGKVGAVNKKDNQVFQTASVTLLWDSSELELVFVAI